MEPIALFQCRFFIFFSPYVWASVCVCVHVHHSYTHTHTHTHTPAHLLDPDLSVCPAGRPLAVLHRPPAVNHSGTLQRLPSIFCQTPTFRGWKRWAKKWNKKWSDSSQWGHSKQPMRTQQTADEDASSRTRRTGFVLKLTESHCFKAACQWAQKQRNKVPCSRSQEWQCLVRLAFPQEECIVGIWTIFDWHNLIYSFWLFGPD